MESSQNIKRGHRKKIKLRKKVKLQAALYAKNSMQVTERS